MRLRFSVFRVKIWGISGLLKTLPSAFNHTQSAPVILIMKRISNEFYQRKLTIIAFWVIFKNIASKREKIGPLFFKFQSISILAISSNRRQETVSVP